jgi:hypothetical protein
MQWLSPVMLTIFAAPLFFKKNANIVLMSTTFVFFYTFWSLGVHYSRVFMAGSTLTIIIAGMMAAVEREQLGRFSYYVQNCVRVALWGAVIWLSVISVKWTLMWPHNISSLYSQDARMESNIKLLQEFPEDQREHQLPTLDELDSISDILDGMPGVKVIAITPSQRLVSILFRNGLFGDRPKFNGDGTINEDRVTAEELFNKYDCALINRQIGLTDIQYATVANHFLRNVFETQDALWQVRCR